MPHLVVGQIPEVLGRESHLVQSRKLRVSLFNHVLFDALHAFYSPPL